MKGTHLLRNKRGLKPMRRINYPVITDLLKAAENDGRSFQEISRLAGYHYNTISQLRQGHRNPSFLMIAHLGQVLGYELTWRKL